MANGSILIADQQTTLRLPVARIRSLARAVMEGEGLAGSLSLAFVDDRAIRAVNRKFLRHDYATDVIAFALEDPADDVVGELVISTEFAACEAAKRRIPAGEEVLRYVAHGILHLAGYDDHAARDRAKMWRRQERYLADPRFRMPDSGRARSGR